jgi:hypothetical protein
LKEIGGATVAHQQSVQNKKIPSMGKQRQKDEYEGFSETPIIKLTFEEDCRSHCGLAVEGLKIKRSWVHPQHGQTDTKS